MCVSRAYANTHPSPIKPQQAVGVIDAPVERVFALFLDNARVREYNDHCVEISDIATLAPDTKVTWSASGRYGPFKVRGWMGARVGLVWLEMITTHPRSPAHRPIYPQKRTPSPIP